MQITASTHQLSLRGQSLLGIRNNLIDLQLFLQIVGEALTYCECNPTVKILPGEIKIEFSNFDDYDWCCDEVAAQMFPS